MAYGIEQKSHLGGYIIGLTDYGDPNSYSTEVWDWMINNGIKSIIDIGCGEGHSTKYFIDNGLSTIGIEGGINAYENSQIKEHIILHDYIESAFITKNYDAVWCCEFVEHVEEKYMENFLKTFDCANMIFLTHALPNQKGYHHVNCQESDYWINIMKIRGFEYNEKLSIYLRSITNKLHVKNSLLVFNKK